MFAGVFERARSRCARVYNAFYQWMNENEEEKVGLNEREIKCIYKTNKRLIKYNLDAISFQFFFIYFLISCQNGRICTCFMFIFRRKGNKTLFQRWSNKWCNNINSPVGRKERLTVDVQKKLPLYDNHVPETICERRKKQRKNHKLGVCMWARISCTLKVRKTETAPKMTNGKPRYIFFVISVLFSIPHTRKRNTF